MNAEWTSPTSFYQFHTYSVNLWWNQNSQMKSSITAFICTTITRDTIHAYFMFKMNSTSAIDWIIHRDFFFWWRKISWNPAIINWYCKFSTRRDSLVWLETILLKIKKEWKTKINFNFNWIEWHIKVCGHVIRTVSEWWVDVCVR